MRSTVAGTLSSSIFWRSLRIFVSAAAPLGQFSLSLKQTELFNLDAGYGTDNNANGVYDEGIDQKDKVSDKVCLVVSEFECSF